MSTVLVTGATGFIALHIVDQLLEKGYKVVGTVRTQEKADKLTANFSNSNVSFVIVPDIATDGVFDNAFISHPEIKYVIHTASPVSTNIQGTLYEHFVAPAVAGSLNALKSAHKYGPNVEHFVFTSSSSAIMNLSKMSDQSFIHTEKSWNPLTVDQISTPGSGYSVSKIEAERQSRAYVAEHDVHFTFSSVCPWLVFGPQLFEDAIDHLSTSSSTFKMVMDLPPDAPGPFNQGFFLACDVRDVARFHIDPIENPAKFANERLSVASGKYIAQTILDSLNEQFPELRGKIPVGDPSAGKEYVDKHVLNYDFSHTLELTGGSFMPLNQIFYDTAKQILDYQKKKESL